MPYYSFNKLNIIIFIQSLKWSMAEESSRLILEVLFYRLMSYLPPPDTREYLFESSRLNLNTTGRLDLMLSNITHPRVPMKEDDHQPRPNSATVPPSSSTVLVTLIRKRQHHHVSKLSDSLKVVKCMVAANFSCNRHHSKWTFRAFLQSFSGSESANYRKSRRWWDERAIC